MSSFFVRTLREDPADAEVASHKLLVRAGYIRRTAPGIYTWLPLGLRVLRKVEAIVREELNASGAQEVLFPALLPREPYERTNRWGEYGPTLFKLKDRKDADYLLAPTHEEMFTLLVKDLYSSYKDLPLNIYQIQTKYRDEARPRAGIIRAREFIMKDAYSFDIDKEGLDASYNTMRDCYERIFTRLGLPYVICSAMSGAMGGSRSEEFLFPCEIGEDTFVRSDGGYAANTEAVVTPSVADEDYSQVGDPKEIPSPNVPTIDTLVDLLNEKMPRTDRPWQASDTLKNVVVVRISPEGERRVVILGVPGDREVDLKRVEASFAPDEVEMATSEDLARFPQLVPGYIGPMVIGPQGAQIVDEETGEKVSALPYLLDAHVARGSRWVTGANKQDVHVCDVVYGRDFEADGRVEAVEVREGDIAPDGSGTLHIARGIEIGHIFQLGKKYAEALDLRVLDENGKQTVVTMGSYGIGVSRVLAALAEINHDDKGLAWPAHLAPVQVYVIPTGKGEEIALKANELAESLESAGFECLLDDRPKVSAGVKFADYELVGAPVAVVVGRALKDGNVEVRNRKSGESVLVEASPQAVYEAVRNVCA